MHILCDKVILTYNTNKHTINLFYDSYLSCNTNLLSKVTYFLSTHQSDYSLARLKKPLKKRRNKKLSHHTRGYKATITWSKAILTMRIRIYLSFEGKKPVLPPILMFENPHP